MVKQMPQVKGFRPIGIPPCNCGETSLLHYDEYEAVRLIDYEGMSQDEAASKMNVSRPTLTRIYDCARKAIAKALVECSVLNIGEGEVEFYGNWHSQMKNNKNIEGMKKIAIPTTDGMLFPHFGHASQFTFVTIEDGKVTDKEVKDAPEHAHGVAPRFVMDNNATEVIAGGMGAMPVNMLMEAGVEVHIGAPVLPVDEIISMYLEGTLTYSGANPCEGHHHEDDGEGHCGGHNHGHCSEHVNEPFKIPNFPTNK